MAEDHQPSPTPSEVCLLLRAHAEQRWLSNELLPVLRQLERPDPLPEEQLGAALAYLEFLWIEASCRAVATDSAYAALGADCIDGGPSLPARARRYHAAVRSLREAVADRVAALLACPGEALAHGRAGS